MTADLYGIAAVDATHAFAVGDDATILATTNGTSWVAQTAPTGIAGALRAVHFVSDSTGWAVGDSAQIITTTNGGTTWTTQTTPAAVESNLHGVWFADADHGCAVGDGATLLTTTDGGKTWNLQTPPDGVTADSWRSRGLVATSCGPSARRRRCSTALTAGRHGRRCRRRSDCRRT